jgi:glycosyltransferase 2 family protein
LSRKLITVAKYLLLLAVAILLLVFAFKGVDVGKIFEEIKETNLFWLFMSVAASIVAFISRAHRWNMLIEPLNYYPKLKNTTYSLMVGYFANLAFPRLGEVTRCGSLSKAERIPFDSLLGTVIVERLIDVICLLILLLLTAVLEFNRLGNFLMENIMQPIQEKSQSYLHSYLFWGIAFVALIALIFLFVFVRKKSLKAGEESKILKLIKGIVNGLRTVGKLKRPGAFIFHTVLIWFMYYLMAYLCFFALPATEHLTWSAGLFVLVVGGMGMSAPVQGGIGAYHLLVSQGLMLYGLSQQHGLAFATLMHSSQTIVVILFGGISLFLLFLGNRNFINDNTAKNKIETP